MLLPPETDVAHPHKSSYRELVESAKTCALCPLILQAGVAEADAASGYRHGKGMWIYSDNEKQLAREHYGARPSTWTASPSAVWTATGQYDPRTRECTIRDIREERLVYGPPRPPDASLRVYIYGSRWSGLDPDYPHLESHGLLLGFGVRFNHDPKPRYVGVRNGLRALCPDGDDVPPREDYEPEPEKTVMDLRGTFLRVGIPYGQLSPSIEVSLLKCV
jgi:hypothetical protein